MSKKGQFADVIIADKIHGNKSSLKLALSATGPIGHDGVLAASLEFWNTDCARRMAKSTAIACN